MVLHDTFVVSDDNKVRGSIGFMHSTCAPSSLVWSMHGPSLISTTSKKGGGWLAFVANNDGESYGQTKVSRQDNHV